MARLPTSTNRCGQENCPADKQIARRHAWHHAKPEPGYRLIFAAAPGSLLEGAKRALGWLVAIATSTMIVLFRTITVTCGIGCLGAERAVGCGWYPSAASAHTRPSVSRCR